MNRIVSGLLASIVIGTAAPAATLTTGALAGSRHRCCLLNAGAKSITNVVPQLRLFDGADAGGSNLCALAGGRLEPGQLCCTQGSRALRDVVYCVITFDGSKSAVRGTLAVEIDGEATAVVEAR